MEKQKFLVGETVWWFYEELEWAVNDAQLDDALDLNKYISHGRIHVCELTPDWEHLRYKLISPRSPFWARSLWLEQEFLFHTKAAREKFDLGMNRGTDCAFGFTIVEKNGGIYPGYPLMKVVELYRNYYKKKLNEMKVPVVYTRREIPKWIRAWERFQYLG